MKTRKLIIFTIIASIIALVIGISSGYYEWSWTTTLIAIAIAEVILLGFGLPWLFSPRVQENTDPS